VENDVHEAGNKTAYKSELQRIHIVANTWGHTNLSTEDARDAEVQGQVLCLKATQLEDESTSLGPMPSLWQAMTLLMVMGSATVLVLSM
jgi:hypothetical protein